MIATKIKKLSLKQVSQKYSSVGGNSLCVRGKFDLAFRFSGQDIMNEAIVMDTSGHCGIIGLDLLRKLDAKIDVVKGILHTSFGAIKLMKTSMVGAVPIRLIKQTVIPVFTTVYATGTATVKSADCDVLIETGAYQNELNPTECMIDIKDNEVTLEFVNQNYEDVVLEKDTIVADLMEITQIRKISSDFPPDNLSNKFDCLPEHLQNKLDKTENLTEEQKQHVMEVLAQNNDLFVGPAAPSGPAMLHGVLRMSRPVWGSVVIPNVLSIHMDNGSETNP
jgi:hypothetical protein